MDEDEDYNGGGGLSKRQKVLEKIAGSTLSASVLEAIYNSATASDKTSALFAKSPCDINNESQFSQRYGMITIADAMPDYDRFRSIETSDETLKMISDLVGEDVSYSTDSQGPELDASIVDRLLRNLSRFTRPRPNKEERPTYQGPAKPAADHNGETARSNHDKKTDLIVDYAAPVHLHPEKDEEEYSQDSSSSEEQADISVLNQRAPRQHADWKLYVYKQGHTLHGRELKVVDDMQTVANVANLFQAAMYGIQDLTGTAQYPKEFRPPVYLLAHGSNSWLYGILEIDGFIKVKRGQIEPVSLKGFPESSTSVNNAIKKFTPSMTQSDVMSKFELWKDDMGWADMLVPDGVHPVGRLFLSYDREEFPSLYYENALTVGRKRYFDGMLKILVGRRATRWSPEDAHKAWDTRKALKTRSRVLVNQT